MRKNFGAKAILYPMPVLILGTYDENGKPDDVVGKAFSDGVKLK